MTHTPHLAAGDDDDGPRRSLVLAGGGMRVAWQAGVLRALGEAGIGFHHGDATSGGVFNLAMLLSGLSPAEMCERWAALPTRDFVSLLALPKYLRSPRWPGLASATGIDEKVFPKLGIDVDRIHAARGLDGTFNVCDFRRKVSVAIPHDEIARELLVAGVSLPALMPAVAHGDGLWLDAVWIRDANPLEGVRRGSDEIWLAWCIGNSGVYRDGTFRQYVHMIETAANGSLFGELDRIRELNERIAAGDAPDGRTSPVRLHVIRPELPIPLDPDYFLGRIDGETLVAIGYRDAWRYLRSRSPEGVALGPQATRMGDGGPGVGFRVRLAGRATIDGVEGPLELRLAVEIGELARFIAEPAGDYAALLGEVRHPAFEPVTLVRTGTFRFDGDRAVYEGSIASGGRTFSLHASRPRRPHAPLEVAIGADGEVASTARLTPSARDVAAQIASLHARNTGNLPAGARAVTRFARALLSG
jgi:hypothetical protein